MRYSECGDLRIATFCVEKTKHNMRLVGHYPEEVIWELTEQREQRASWLALCRVVTEEDDSQPVFRVYHWVWRKFELWKTL